MKSQNDQKVLQDQGHIIKKNPKNKLIPKEASGNPYTAKEKN